MIFRRSAIAIFLASLITSDYVFGFSPSSTCRSQSQWGLLSTSSTKTPQFLSQTRLPVSISSTTPASDVVEDFDDEVLDPEVLELLDEDDDDDEDYEISLSKKEDWMQELERLARTCSRDPEAVAQAQAIFDEMFEAYVKTEETSMWPTVEVYNLLLEIHAYSRSDDGGEEAEKILTRMEDDSVEFIARPNLKTYMNVMDAWAMRKNPEKAQAILDRLEKRYAERNEEAVKPTANAYNKLIKAHGMAGDVERAESILRDLLEREGDLKANHKTWVQTMKAYAPLSDGTEKVQSLFKEMLNANRMGEEEYMPKTDAHNTLIRALGQKWDGAEEAEAMLFDMINQFRAGNEDIRPNAETFRNVLAAQKRRRNVSGAKVEQLLQIQEGLYATTKREDLKMDGRLYNVALGTIARSRDANKAVRARRIIAKMKTSEDESNTPTVRTYYTLLSACAYTGGTPEENFEAFQIAVDTLKEVKENLGREPDSACFGMFLKACANLMPVSRKRDAVVGNVFRKCCRDGLVNDFVLNEFEKASSEALQLEVLGGFLEDDVRLPEEWSTNVVERAFF
jgi:pentatricopeptide repeat protein